MKKALIVLLALAVAGGLFAQVSFSGGVESGLAIGFTDQEGDKPVIDFIENRGEHNMKATINGDFSGEGDYGSYGAHVGFENHGGWQEIFTGKGIAPDYSAYVWWEPSSLLNVRIGKGGPYDFGSLAGSGNLLRTWQPGLYALSKPVDNLQIGAQFFYGGSHDGSSEILEKIRAGFGIKYGLPDLLDINAQAQIRGADDPTGLYFIAGAKFNGVPGLGIAAELGGYDFNNSKNNAISIGEKIDFSTGALSLSLRAQQLIAMGDDLSKDFMPMLFHGEVGYTVSDTVSLGIQGRYLMGKGPNFNWRNAGELGNYDIDDYVPSTGEFYKDNKKAALGISPEINLNLGPKVKIGYNIQMDMTDGAKASADTYTIKHLPYIQVGVSF